MSQQSNHQNSNFWFGMIVGSVAGGTALYFLGTQSGRKRLRDIVDACEDLDSGLLEDILESVQSSEENEKKTVPAIHAVLDKIQSSLPTQKEVQKFFVREGKILK